MPLTPYDRPVYPVLLLISGPSGVGKDTIARRVIERKPDEFYFVVTATTRPPRDDEVEGVDYFFVTQSEFARMIDDDELLEYAFVYGDYKGVPKQQIREALDSGKNVIMRVDVQGAATVRELIPEVITVYLTTPTEDDLVQRLIERDSESEEALKIRIARARDEIRHLKEFDYCVVNADDDQETAVDHVLAIVDAAQCRVEQHPIQV